MASPPPRPEKRPMSPQVAVVTAAGALVAGVLVFLVVANVARTSGGSGGGADGTPAERRAFVVGRADRLADSVARHGPLLIQDPLEGVRNIYVQHLGGDTWRVFETRAPGAPLKCQLEWRPATRDFYDKCSDRAYPADGAGLVSYPTRIDEDGRLLVDLTSPTSPA